MADVIEFRDIQKVFLIKAINLQDAVINYQVSDEEFLEDYGCTKDDMRNAVEIIRKQTEWWLDRG